MESLSNPARTAILPAIIKKDTYLSASSYLTSSTTFGDLLGIGLAGVFISVFGTWFALLLDGLTFFISAILIFSLKFSEKENITSKGISFKNFTVMIKEGFLYLKKNKLLISILLLAAFVNFSFIPYNVLRPVYAEEVLHMGVE
jgi:DHA3 family macrolide efflux protein-like MFS transporter